MSREDNIEPSLDGLGSLDQFVIPFNYKFSWCVPNDPFDMTWWILRKRYDTSRLILPVSSAITWLDVSWLLFFSHSKNTLNLVLIDSLESNWGANKSANYRRICYCVFALLHYVVKGIVQGVVMSEIVERPTEDITNLSCRLIFRTLDQTWFNVIFNPEFYWWKSWNFGSSSRF